MPENAYGCFAWHLLMEEVGEAGQKRQRLLYFNGPGPANITYRAMNELDKQSPFQEATDNSVAPVASETIRESGNESHDEMICGNVENECKETESPAMSIAETADAVSGNSACAETCSPALDMAEAADSESEDMPNVHSMSKEQLLNTLRRIVADNDMEAHREVAAVKQAFYALKNRENQQLLSDLVDAGNEPSAFAAPVDEVENEVKDLLADFREKRNAYLEGKEEERRMNLEKKKEVIAQINTLVEDIDNINLNFSKFQELQSEFKKIGEVPPANDSELWKSYQLAVEQFYDRLKMNKELRDLDFKKNLEIKHRLLDEAKSLGELADPVEAFKRLQVLHEEWKQTGPVAKDLREAIWNDFREASTVVNKRHQDYFQNRKAEEQANEEAKTALCEEAEGIDVAAVKTFSDWEETTKRIIDMQQRWRGLGFASKKSNARLFTRFRKACDDFFRAKADFYKNMKEEYSTNLEKKRNLCERAEALMARVDERNVHEEMKALQAEWKTVGTVSRKHSDEIWQRFSKACNEFYDIRKKKVSSRRDDENANLAAKRDIIARLKEISSESDRKEVIAQVRSLQDEWQKIGHVPFRSKDKVYDEYRAELDRIYGSFEARESRRRINDFAGHVKEMNGDGARMSRERERLLRAIDAKKGELQTYENNMGFFNVKSSAGSSMLKDLERRIARIKDDIAQLKEKLTLLDSENKEQ